MEAALLITLMLICVFGFAYEAVKNVYKPIPKSDWHVDLEEEETTGHLYLYVIPSYGEAIRIPISSHDYKHDIDSIINALRKKKEEL